MVSKLLLLLLLALPYATGCAQSGTPSETTFPQAHSDLYWSSTDNGHVYIVDPPTTTDSVHCDKVGGPGDVLPTPTVGTKAAKMEDPLKEVDDTPSTNCPPEECEVVFLPDSLWTPTQDFRVMSGDKDVLACKQNSDGTLSECKLATGASLDGAMTTINNAIRQIEQSQK